MPERTGTDRYRRMRSSSRTATKKMESDMVRTTARINQSLATTSVAVGNFAKAFAGFSSNINQTIKDIAKIGDEAKLAGLSAQAFQEWKFVAEQNRVGIDALVDGFKELSLRAGELIVTGGGSAAEAFARLGYSAEDLKQKLKDPSALMLEIIGRLQDIDKAAQIRIADELFGGTGGEQFVQLLEQGDAAIAKTKERGHELGAVMNDQMIKKAQGLDRRWNELAATTGDWFKGMAIGIADTIAQLFVMQNALGDLLGDEGRGRAILGDEAYEVYKQSAELVEENRESLERLEAAYSDITEQARALAIQLTFAADQAQMMGDDDACQVFATAGTDINNPINDFQNGLIPTGQDFIAKLEEIRTKADEAWTELDRGNATSFGPVLSEIEALGSSISGVIGLAKSLHGWVTAVANLSAGPGQDTGTPLSGRGLDLLPPTTDAHDMGSSPRPQLPGIDSHADWEEASRGGGGKKKGGGGKGKTSGRIESLVNELQTEREILEEWFAESLELLNGATEQQFEAFGGKHEAIERLEREHKERMAQIQEASNQFTLESALGAGADILGAMGSMNKKALKISQGFAAAEAFVSTMKGAAKELEKGTFGFATAALVISKGMGFIAAIKGASESGNSGGGGRSAGRGSAPQSSAQPSKP